MAMNTPYLTSDTATSSGSINTPYILTGATAFNSDVSSTGSEFVGGKLILRGALQSASAISGGAITGTTGTFTSTLTAGGAATFTSNVSAQAGLDVSQTTQALFLSYNTTASAASTILPTGAFGIYFQSATSCRLCYRSGNTTYTWIATTGAVL